MSPGRGTVRGMTETELFLASDADLRSVIDRLTPDQLTRRMPQDWSSTPDPTLRDIVVSHLYDESWVPDVIAGRTAEEVGDRWAGDLAGDDVIAAYDRANDLATAAVRSAFPDGVVPADAVAHFTYGDFPLVEGLVHIASYRAFQAWLIAKEVGIPFHLSPAVIEGSNRWIVPAAAQWREWQVLPPEIEPPAGADEETVLLCRLGYWHE
jgi:hypothetical protein